MKIRPLALIVATLLAFPLLLCPPGFPARARVDVRVRVNEGVGKYPPQDSLNKYNSPVAGPLMSNEIFYFNVTVLSDNADAVANNKGQWCIKGDVDLSSNEYHATLSGNDLEVEVPQKNGKMSKAKFVIYDHKWRKLADI
jgi:hypothetical protein